MGERIFVDRTTTWHAIGKSVSECKSVEQVLRASGLDYEVVKKPVFTSVVDGGALVEVPNRFMTVNSRGKIYDAVSDKFQLVQNREAFELWITWAMNLASKKSQKLRTGGQNNG